MSYDVTIFVHSGSLNPEVWVTQDGIDPIQTAFGVMRAFGLHGAFAVFVYNNESSCRVGTFYDVTLPEASGPSLTVSYDYGM